MLLINSEIVERFNAHPFGSQDAKVDEATVLVKYFNPCGPGTWLITEAEKQEDGDWMLYGYCHIFVWEWGYVMLSDLQKMALPFGLTIERDLYIGGDAKVKDLIW